MFLRLRIIATTCALLSPPAAFTQKFPGGGQQGQGGQNQSPSQAQGSNQTSASSPNSGLSWPRDAWDTTLTTIDTEHIYPKDTPIFKLCYRLDVTTGSLSSVPFIFSQVDTIVGDADAGHKCVKQVDSRHPLMMRGLLIVAVDARHVPTDRMRSITLNLTTQQGTPIYPNPIRPSPGAAPTSGSPGAGGGLPEKYNPHEQPWGKIYYLVWPQQLQGDVIPTVSLSLVYTPPVPGTQWTENTVYPEGSVVTSSANDGHYYVARQGGISGSAEPTFKPLPAVEDPDNSGVEWIDSGTTQPSDLPAVAGTSGPQTAPGQQTCCCQQTCASQQAAPAPQPASAPRGESGAQACPAQPAAPAQAGVSGTMGPGLQSAKQLTVPTWTRCNQYNEGDVIFVPSNGHYYTATRAGESGPIRPGFPANQQILIPDGTPSLPTPPDSVPDRMIGKDRIVRTVRWTLKSDPGAAPGCSLPVGRKPQSQFPDWNQDETYTAGNCIKEPTAQAYFQFTSPNLPGSEPYRHIEGMAKPPFSSVVGARLQQLPQIQWEDTGTSPSTLVAAGQPADQTVSQTYQLPQVHSKYYFNLTSGVIVSSVHSQTFGWGTITQPSGSGSTAQPGSYMAVRTGGSVIVDPVLFFSAYLWPMDAESTSQKSDLRPALTFGLSLSAPASNFYFGLSSEFRRNVQVVYGFTAAQQAKLAPGLYQPTNPAPGTCRANCSTSNATPPPTIETFKPGGFVGISYNITGFIQSLFGGGGSKGSSQ
jgi:hypothetical protein